MLFPKFSTKLLFAFTTLAALVLACINFAIDGQIWAIGISVAVLTIPLIFSVYAGFFLLSFAIMRLFKIEPKRDLASPFVTESIRSPSIPAGNDSLIES